MIYFLLSIIAVGVLLISDDGKELLNQLVKILVVIGVSYLAFWIIVFIVSLLSDSHIRDNLIHGVGYIVLAFVVITYINAIISKYKKGDFEYRIIKSKARKLWLENWNQSLGIKITMIFLIITCIGLIGLFAYSFTIPKFWQ